MIPILLYHGTIDKFSDSFHKNGIILTKAKPRADFGPGFYTSDTYGFAKRTAIRHALKFNNKSDDEKVRPMVLTIEVDDTAFARMKCREFSGVNSDWLRFVLYNRVSASKKQNISGDECYDARDVVVGPIADAGVVNLIYDIEEDSLDWRDVVPSDVAPYQGGTDLQISFHNNAALAYLKIIKYDIIDLPERS